MKLEIAVLNAECLQVAVTELVARHPEFGVVVAHHGVPSLRPMACGLEGLLLTVTEQFLSLAAAAAIWRRMADACDMSDPQAVLAIDEEGWMALGLSRAKARSFRGIADAIREKRVDVDGLSRLPNEEARAQLLALPGVGPWTADIYLLAALQRADVWPWGDLALQLSAQNLFGLPTRPGKREMADLGEMFRPWQAVAARLLWSHYRAVKGMKQAP